MPGFRDPCRRTKAFGPSLIDEYAKVTAQFLQELTARAFLKETSSSTAAGTSRLGKTFDVRRLCALSRLPRKKEIIRPAATTFPRGMDGASAAELIVGRPSSRR